ncbi:tyrosine-type recombinase/integrase [Sphingomonas sp. HMP6]|uniref:tyrosine-type recombinase/integrase n=1 Tax=Sphingomonas sp. HMP6 TaxID=1517551 RepID=UPI0015970183|nr:tyrosine-type recombinase/integrase [Sphingomonas sp. HMP6]BCA60061.1 hypothetical protein HMP06_2830 [Sphingomonas sp. HMP6]
MNKRLAYVSSFVDRHGKRRYRFRRNGYPVHYFKEPHGTKAFEREYADCLNADAVPIGAGRVKPGSVADVIARYYADNSFMDLRPSTQAIYRGVLERLRDKFGDDPIRLFDAERLSRLMTLMRDRPHAAARLRKLFAQLFVIARRAKLVPHGFDPVRDTKPPKAVSEGYHRWTEDELDAFEAKHPLGTKPRLAFAMLLYGAQRSGDVRYMTRETIADGRIRLDQSKTSTAVDVPVVQPLRDALEAGPLGKSTLLETKGGEPFTPKGFYGMFKRACIAADLPHCSPHGLRKSAARRCKDAGCTNEQGMAITGHKTEKEYLRYAGTGARPDLADEAMVKVLANSALRLANADTQTPVESR